METIPAEILIPETPAQVTCKACGNPVDCPRNLERVALKFGVYCDPCFNADNQRIFKEAEANAKLFDVSGWERLCPPEFQHTEPHRLPSPSKLQKVLEWKFGPKGLVLHGPTGAGKSRCLYQLLKREFKESRRIRILGPDSGYQYAERFSQSPADVLRWIEDKQDVDILALDDVFKVKLTESFEQSLFVIVNFRTERNRPVLVTCQDVGQSLIERMSPDRGAAFVRRLREFCTPVSFTV